MSVERQFNWLGQQRVDVPHLRTIDSSNSNDFDNLAGQSLAGGQALVVRGFVMVTHGAIGQPATALQLQVDPGIVWHVNASEAGTVFRTAVGTAAELLTSTNPKVNGSFTASQLNYVGIDLLRSSDPTTSDLVEFLDADTLKEEPETVPLARTLNYSIVISTTSFTSQPNVLPIALVTTDGANNVVSIVDARNMAFRLGTGGTTPNVQNTYAWPQGRNETANSIANGGDGFSGGDKAFGSLRDAVQAMESRLQELGGGPFWYSKAADRQVKLVRNLATRFATGDNFFVNVSDGNLWWQGLAFAFCNAQDTSGNPVYQNLIADQTSSLTGTTDIQVGECIYVDINEQPAGSLYPGFLTVTAQKGTMANLGVPSPPFTRWVIAWRTAYGYFTRDSQFGVGTILSPASTTANGVVELNANPFSGTNPVVVVADASGNAIATGISRGSGSVNPFFTAGTLAIGFGTNDTTVIVGSTTLTNQNVRLGYGPSSGTHNTYVDGTSIILGSFSTNPAIQLLGFTNTIGTGVSSDTTTLQSVTVNLTGATNQTTNLNAFSGATGATNGTYNIYTNLTDATPGSLSGSVVVGNNNASTWTGFFSIGDYTTAGATPVASGFNLIALTGGFNMAGAPGTFAGAGPFNVAHASSLNFTVDVAGGLGSSGLSFLANPGAGTASLLQIDTNTAVSGSIAATMTLGSQTGITTSTTTLEALSNASTVFTTLSGAAILNVLARSNSQVSSTPHVSRNATNNVLALTSTDGTNFAVATLNLGATNKSVTVDNSVPPAGTGNYIVNIYTDIANGDNSSINIMAFGGNINIGQVQTGHTDNINILGNWAQTGDNTGLGSFSANFLIVSGTTALPSQACPMFVFNIVGGAQTLTLPGAPLPGQIVIIKQAIANSGPVTIKSFSSGTPIDGTAGSVGVTISSGYGVLRLIYEGQWFTW